MVDCVLLADFPRFLDLLIAMVILKKPERSAEASVQPLSIDSIGKGYFLATLRAIAHAIILDHFAFQPVNRWKRGLG